MLAANDAKTEIVHIDVETKKKTSICSYVEVTRIIKKIPNTLEDELEVLIRDEKEETTCRIPLSKIYEEKEVLAILAGSHLFIHPKFKKAIFNYIIEQAWDKKKNQVYSYENTCLGWQVVEGKNTFLYDETALNNGKHAKCIRDVTSFKNGSEAEYNKLITNVVIPSKELSLAYALGFSGVIISRLAKYRDLGVIIVGLSGKSTTGKTTSLQLIASIWGDTRDSSSFFVRNDASGLGFKAQYAGMYGVPCLFDDITTNEKLDMSDFIYSSAKGQGRIVSNTKGQVDRSRLGFSGICITTSEMALTEHTRKDQGLFARLLDFGEISWTKSAQESDTIKNTVFENYGFKGIKFAKKIENIPDEILLKLYDKALEEILPKLPVTDSFSSRVAKKYAAIKVTMDLHNKIFQHQLPTEEVIDMVLNLEITQVKSRDIVREAHDYLKEYFYTAKNCFDVKYKGGELVKAKSFKRTGVAVYKDDGLHLYIPTGTARAILSEADYKQFKTYKKAWRDRGMLISPNERDSCAGTTMLNCRHYHLLYTDIVPQYIKDEEAEYDDDRD